MRDLSLRLRDPKTGRFKPTVGLRPPKPPANETLEIRVREIPITRAHERFSEVRRPCFPEELVTKVREQLDRIERPSLEAHAGYAPGSEPTVVLDERGVREFHGRGEFYADHDGRVRPRTPEYSHRLEVDPERGGDLGRVKLDGYQVRRERIRAAEIELIAAAESVRDAMERGIFSPLATCDQWDRRRPLLSEISGKVDALRKARLG